MPVSNVMFSLSLLNQNRVVLVRVEEDIDPTFWPFFKLPWETKPFEDEFRFPMLRTIGCTINISIFSWGKKFSVLHNVQTSSVDHSVSNLIVQK